MYFEQKLEFCFGLQVLELQRKQDEKDMSYYEQSIAEFTYWLSNSEQTVGAVPEPGDERTLKKYQEENRVGSSRKCPTNYYLHGVLVVSLSLRNNIL